MDLMKARYITIQGTLLLFLALTACTGNDVPASESLPDEAVKTEEKKDKSKPCKIDKVPSSVCLRTYCTINSTVTIRLESLDRTRLREYVAI